MHAVLAGVSNVIKRHLHSGLYRKHLTAGRLHCHHDRSHGGGQAGGVLEQ